jgi:hypothetical protein
MQHVASTAPMRDECLTQPPQLELVGHSIVSVFCFEHPTPHTKRKKRKKENLSLSKSNHLLIIDQDFWTEDSV